MSTCPFASATYDGVLPIGQWPVLRPQTPLSPRVIVRASPLCPVLIFTRRATRSDTRLSQPEIRTVATRKLHTQPKLLSFLRIVQELFGCLGSTHDRTQRLGYSRWLFQRRYGQRRRRNRVRNQRWGRRQRKQRWCSDRRPRLVAIRSSTIFKCVRNSIRNSSSPGSLFL